MSNIIIPERIHYIGASEVADLFGVGFKSRWQLWLEKAGRIDAEDLSENELVNAGRYLEPGIAEWALNKWNMRLRKVHRYITHPHIQKFGCSLDYESQEGTLIPVEIKLNWWGKEEHGWVLEGDTILDAPLKYLLQVQSQLACTGAAYGWLIALVKGRLCRMKIDMHRDTVATIEYEVEEFWKSIAENKEPKPDFSSDSGLIASLMQVDREKVLDLSTDNHLPVLCAEYQAAAAIAKDGEARKDAALAEIRSIIGDAGKVLTNGFTISNSIVGETQVSYVRKAYPITRITAKKEKAHV